MIRRPPRSTHRYTLFPYTTLFRSIDDCALAALLKTQGPIWLGLSERSEEHTSELQSHSGSSYAVFCLKKKKIDLQPAAKSITTSRYLVNRTNLWTSTFFRFSAAKEKSRIPEHRFFFFNDTATTQIYTPLYTLSLHDALPICRAAPATARRVSGNTSPRSPG